MLIFPIGTERQLRGFPWATVGLIVVNSYVYFALQSGPGASNFPLIWVGFQWWMPVTYMFAHSGLSHLLGNMLILWVFGPHAEDALGSGRFLLLYFSAGFASAGLHVLASALLYPEDLMVGLLGASGAIMGVVALFVLRFHGVRVRFFFWFILPAVFYLRALWVGIAYLLWDLGWALATIGSEGIGGVAHWAHLGGFAAGALWAWGLRLPEEGTHEVKQREARALMASGAISSAAELLEQRIAARPGDLELHADAAQCCELLRGASERALAHWNEHLRLLLLAGRVEEALERFRDLAARYQPHDFDPAVLLRVGAAAEGRGLDDLALAAWVGVAQAHPESGQAPTAALRAARLLLRRGRADRAREVLAQITCRWPDAEEALTAAHELRELNSTETSYQATENA